MQVGFIVLPGDVTIVIEPKLQIDTIFALLAAAYDPDREVFGDEPQSYSTVTELFEFVVKLFVENVEDLVVRGLLRRYRSVAEDPPAVKGRLMIQETIRRRPVLQDRHWCTFSRFTINIVENQIVCATAAAVRGLNFADSYLAPALQRIAGSLAAVEVVAEPLNLFARLEFDRLNETYRPALKIARLLLEHLTFSGTSGDEPFLSFLIDMNWLFEEYVCRTLAHDPRSWEGDVARHPERSLDGNNRIKVIPDAVLTRNGEPCLVIDAKYKLSAAQEDLYQMIAYCHALGLSSAVLIHPQHEASPEGNIHVRGPGSIQIHYLSLDLGGKPDQLAVHRQRLLKMLEPIVAVSESTGHFLKPNLQLD